MNRPEQITTNFLSELDKHIADIASGKTDVFFEIHDFANILCIHPIHLSNTVKQVTGKPPCDHCEGKLALVAREMLEKGDMTVTQIARRLTYDPPGFTKFFKKYVGETPGSYQKRVQGYSVSRTEKI